MFQFSQLWIVNRILSAFSCSRFADFYVHRIIISSLKLKSVSRNFTQKPISISWNCWCNTVDCVCMYVCVSYCAVVCMRVHVCLYIVRVYVCEFIYEYIHTPCTRIGLTSKAKICFFCKTPLFGSSKYALDKQEWETFFACVKT